MNPGTILMIEDDPFASEWVDLLVRKHFAPAYELWHVRSEREFLGELVQVETLVPSAIILDLILPWEDGSPLDKLDRHHHPPRGNIYEAGVRIALDIQASAELREIPILLFTVSDKQRISLPDSLRGFDILQKGDDDKLLIDWLKEHLRLSAARKLLNSLRL